MKLISLWMNLILKQYEETTPEGVALRGVVKRLTRLVFFVSKRANQYSFPPPRGKRARVLRVPPLDAVNS